MVLVPVALSGCGLTSGRFIRPMLNASSHGDTVELRDLVGRGGDVNAKSRDGWAPLHVAAGAGKLDSVEWLVGQGALVDVPNDLGQTPLCIAAGLGHADVVRYLIGVHADVDAGFPLYLACKHGDLETVQALIDAGCDVNRKSGVSDLAPAHVAAALGHADILAALLRAGADPGITGRVGEMEVTPGDIAESNREHRDALLAAFQHPESYPSGGEPGTIPLPESSPVTKAAAGTPQDTRPVERTEDSIDSSLMDQDLVRIDMERARQLATRALAAERPDIDLEKYTPSYVLCLTHPDAHPFISVVVEWLGRDSLEVQKGETDKMDRVRVKKLSVKLSKNGHLVEIKHSDTWLYRNL